MGNTKVGEIIIDNPHKVSQNVKLLLDIVDRHNLTIVNSTENAQENYQRNKLRKSIIGYIIICERMNIFLESMKIYEEKSLVLTRYGRKTVEQRDHNLLSCEFNIDYKTKGKKEKG